MNEQKRELRVISIDTGEVVHVVDVSDKSDSLVEKAMSGLLRRIDDDKYYVEDSADK